MIFSRPVLWDSVIPVLRLVGLDSRTFLHGQTTGDIMQLTDGKYLPSLWLSSIGRVRALIEINIQGEVADVLVLAGEVETIARNFEEVIFPADQVKVEKIFSKRRCQILGLSNQDRPYVVEYSSIESTIPKDVEDLEKATEEQVEFWRLSQGLPFSQNELGGAYNPFELGLADWLSLDKGCYLGQETIAKVSRGGKVKQALRFWRSKSHISQGEKLFGLSLGEVELESAGLITSAANFSFEEGTIGLAMVRRKFLEDKELVLSDNVRKIQFSEPLGFFNSFKES